jgi:NAD(P)-dependent dehydrogenase (short-subunit alcohol dehydrogenase family)
MSSPRLFDLSGRIAAVTGGNGGIGRSIALGLAQAGAAVAVLARNEDKNQRVIGELHALGVPTFAIRVDVTARGQVREADLLQSHHDHLGGISGAVLRTVVCEQHDAADEVSDKIVQRVDGI